jgi:hypothetical protein
MMRKVVRNLSENNDLSSIKERTKRKNQSKRYLKRYYKEENVAVPVEEFNWFDSIEEVILLIASRTKVMRMITAFLHYSSNTNS